ncbi:molybdenum cofactor guanylyltransferase [Chloroflexota bacterium]
MDISGIVLAGGKSLRLGYDKVLETVGKRSLLQQVVSCVATLSSEVILVTTSEQTIPESIDYPKLRTVTDIYPGKGPLGGIYTGLATSTSFCNLVVASDMPFLNPDLFRYMMQLADNFNAVVPRISNLVEPLHAVYTKSCLAPMEQMIKQDKLSVNQLLNLVRTRYVEAEEIEKFDPEHLSFFNVNTKADLAKARELAKGCKS